MALPRAPLVVSVALALAIGACGGDSGGSRYGSPADTNPTASAPDAKAPPPDATQPGTDQVAPPAGTEPGAGDEVPVRVPAAFVARDGVLAPRTITVPPFLAVELSIVAADGSAHRLVLRTPTPRTLTVAAGERAALQVPGLRAGRYVVELDGRPAGALVAGGEVGP